MNLLIETADGSHSIHSNTFNASYHSSHGAMQESKTVFINAGLNYILNNDQVDINILEIGFGSGLNAFISYLELKNRKVNISYDGFELYLVDIETVGKLNYPQLLNAVSDKEVFYSFHQNPGHNISVELCDRYHFNFKLYNYNFEDYYFEQKYQLVYFDAFAPNVQPQLWQVKFLKKMYDSMKIGGILVTYCAQGAFKRALKEVGFKVETLPGPIGKREMTRAIR